MSQWRTIKLTDDLPRLALFGGIAAIIPLVAAVTMISFSIASQIAYRGAGVAAAATALLEWAWIAIGASLPGALLLIVSLVAEIVRLSRPTQGE